MSWHLGVWEDRLTWEKYYLSRSIRLWTSCDLWHVCLNIQTFVGKWTDFIVLIQQIDCIQEYKWSFSAEPLIVCFDFVKAKNKYILTQCRTQMVYKESVNLYSHLNTTLWTWCQYIQYVLCSMWLSRLRLYLYIRHQTTTDITYDAQCFLQHGVNIWGQIHL